MSELKFLAFHPERGVLIPRQLSATVDIEKGNLRFFSYLKNGSEIELKLMQYTGIKDKNGREIYEGFIVNLIWVSTKCNGYIKFDDGSYALFDKNDKRITSSIGEPFSSSMVVIGNIYENKNLLDYK